jgi:hypothetical protein
VPVAPSNVAWIALAALATLAALVQTARIAWTRASRRWVLANRFARASAGEARGERLLVAAGYEVLARQVAGAWTLRADGEPVEVAVRADLLVAKDGRRYVAEVKTGAKAPRVDHIATRRQLLEYKIAFDVDGVVLVDAESDRVVHVDVGDLPAAAPEGPRGSAAVVAFAFGVAVGAALVVALAR